MIDDSRVITSPAAKRWSHQVGIEITRLFDVGARFQHVGSVAGGGGDELPSSEMTDLPGLVQQLKHEVHGLKDKVHELELWRQSQSKPGAAVQPLSTEIAVLAPADEGLEGPKARQEGSGEAPFQERKDIYQEPGDFKLRDTVSEISDTIQLEDSIWDAVTTLYIYI